MRPLLEGLPLQEFLIPPFYPLEMQLKLKSRNQVNFSVYLHEFEFLTHFAIARDMCQYLQLNH